VVLCGCFGRHPTHRWAGLLIFSIDPHEANKIQGRKPDLGPKMADFSSEVPFQK
jgi:hypothetical protein